MFYIPPCTVRVPHDRKVNVLPPTPPLTSSNRALRRSLRLLSIRGKRGELLRADDARARYPRGVERAVAVRVRGAGTEARRERDRPCPS